MSFVVPVTPLLNRRIPLWGVLILMVNISQLMTLNSATLSYRRDMQLPAVHGNDCRNNPTVSREEDRRHGLRHDLHNLTDLVTDSPSPGIAACLLILEDTMRLAEWIAYHYTVLPLSRLIIALDPFNSEESVQLIHEMAAEWRLLGVDIEIWTNDTFLLDENVRTSAFNAQRDAPSGPDKKLTKVHDKRQQWFVNECMKDQKAHNQTWTLLTDSDEFLVYNYMQEFENSSSYAAILDWKPREIVHREREMALPIRQALPPLTTSVRSFLDNLDLEGLPNSRCLRLTGLWFGCDESTTLANPSDVTQQAIDPIKLMSLRFAKYSTEVGAFSKVMIDVSRVAVEQFQMKFVNTIHNPNTAICGKNGRWASGADFMSSIFRINHYFGTKESFRERALAM